MREPIFLIWVLKSFSSMTAFLLLNQNDTDMSSRQTDRYKFVWRPGREEQKWKVEYAAPSICIWAKRSKVCVFIFHPRADAHIPLSLPLFFSHRSLSDQAPCPQKLTACIVTSRRYCFVGGLSNNKQSHTTLSIEHYDSLEGTTVQHWFCISNFCPLFNWLINGNIKHFFASKSFHLKAWPFAKQKKFFVLS